MPSHDQAGRAAGVRGSVDARTLRKVLGHLPTGVTVVTAMASHIDAKATPYGMTIGTFTSVSLEPPLVGFLVQRSSTTCAAIAGCGKFCVNVLGHTQQDLCRRFADGAPIARFDAVPWSLSPSGSPVIDGALASIDCVLADTYQMGDHLFVLGHVIDLADANGADPAPLLFFRGEFGRFAGHRERVCSCQGYDAEALRR